MKKKVAVKHSQYSIKWLSGSLKNITTQMASMPSHSEKSQGIFDYNQNAKNTMSQIQNQDFLFRPFVSTAVSMMSNGTS